jgi:hypothetical protein
MGDLPPQLIEKLRHELGDMSRDIAPFLELLPGVPATVELFNDFLYYLDVHRRLETGQILPEFPGLRVLMEANPTYPNLPMKSLKVRVSFFCKPLPDESLYSYDSDNEGPREDGYDVCRCFEATVGGVRKALDFVVDTVNYARNRGFCSNCLAEHRKKRLCASGHGRCPHCIFASVVRQVSV